MLMSRSHNKHMHQEEFKRSNRDKRMEAKSSNFVNLVVVGMMVVICLPVLTVGIKQI